MNIENLLKLLKEHKVKFVIIGAQSFPVYGYARATFDIDIFIEPTKKNAKMTLQALEEFGYDVIGFTTLEDFLTKKTLIRQYLLATDIHPFVKGVSFKDVWKNKIRAKIGNTYAYFPSLADMVRMKKAAGRTRDKEDLKYLGKLLKSRLRKK
jgi:predicted nucleotidyltransferase